MSGGCGGGDGDGGGDGGSGGAGGNGGGDGVVGGAGRGGGGLLYGGIKSISPAVSMSATVVSAIPIVIATNAANNLIDTPSELISCSFGRVANSTTGCNCNAGNVVGMFLLGCARDFKSHEPVATPFTMSVCGLCFIYITTK